MSWLTDSREAPARLLDPPRILTASDCRPLAERIGKIAAEMGVHVSLLLHSGWSGELRWGRNRASLASDRRDTVVLLRIRRAQFTGTAWHVLTGQAALNQLDEVSLAAAIRAADRQIHYHELRPTVRHAPEDEWGYPFLKFESLKPQIWSETTSGLTPEARADVSQSIIEAAEQAEMLSSGYLAVQEWGLASIDSEHGVRYTPCTQARCAMTVRDARGTGSGWAGGASYDWARIDASALASRAVEKCVKSRNPVALEPGRYTVILEPQAVCDLIDVLVEGSQHFRDPNVSPLSRRDAEQGRVEAHPFTLRPGFSKIGEKVVDERITLSHDPLDPDLGVIPFTQFWWQSYPFWPVVWIERGVLKTLGYGRSYALEQLNENVGYPNSGSYRMSGGDTTVEEMIRATRRGLLVTRFSNVRLIDAGSLLTTGLTRDGLWLIENGAITKPVKNLRFTESPLFVLNSVDALGTPTPVFRPGAALNEWSQSPLVPAVVPPIKARDFSFTAVADAI
jgi:predicted Zn-dependent protease